MALDWLKNRLTRVKRETPRWAELAEALETFWEAQFDAEYAKALTLRSIYTANSTDQQRMLAELGEFYERDLDDKNRAVAFAMRKLELLQKETTVLITNYIQRHGIATAKWESLYALKAEVYGTRFLTASELIAMGEVPGENTLSLRLDGTWKVKSLSPVKLSSVGNYLTSRGRIICNLAEVERTAAFGELGAFVRRIKPLHIVYAGILSKLWFEIYVPSSTQYAASISKELTQPYAWPAARLDGTWQVGTPADKKIKVNAEASLRLVKSTEAGLVRTERLGRPLRSLGILEHDRLDGTWQIGGMPLNGSWKLNGLTRLTVKRLGTLHSRLKLDGSWWIGSTKHLDGAWKVGANVTGVKTEARVIIRKIAA